MPAEQPPYWDIRQGLLKGEVIPFLGAGASFGARNPNTTPWRTPDGQGGWTVSHFPTARELADFFGVESALAQKNIPDLPTAAQYYAVKRDGKGLRDCLHDIFTLQPQPLKIHNYLADVAKTKPLLIITTNYDDLIEQAFDNANQPYDKIVHVTDPDLDAGDVLLYQHGNPVPEPKFRKDLDVDVATRSIIYKIHGAIDRVSKANEQYVITEDHYIDFLTKMTEGIIIPKRFAEIFRDRRFLFIGYGLGDWNLRVILNRFVRPRTPGQKRSWAIESRKKPIDKKLWEWRDVTMYDNLPIDTFVDNLIAAKAPGIKP